MSPATVTVHALEAGYLTLPERFFVEPLQDENARKTVPSLSFLIQHQRDNEPPIRVIFDLGVRRDLEAYSPEIRRHAATRQPLITKPDVVDSLAGGSILPQDIDLIILSHVHWDHIGMPSDFPSSTFIVGDGAMGLLDGSHILQNGSHSHFERGLLPADRTIELPSTDYRPPSPPQTEDILSTNQIKSRSLNLGPWQPLRNLENAIDLFDDGSLYIVNAPGHLPGHVNLLCKTGINKYVYLAGDSCHDPRLLSGELNIAEWKDQSSGAVCCIHADRPAAEKTIKVIRSLLESGNAFGEVEAIFAHDAAWAADAKARGKFFPGVI